MFAIPLFLWAATTLVRMDGLSGAGDVEFFWRWIPTAEERFLAERARSDQKAANDEQPAAAEPLVASEQDWPRFRGVNADSALHGVKIATNWDESPPRLVWRRRMGPGWSSITVVGDRLFTQEQRGEREAVVCFDAATGNEIWAHEDNARFSEELGGDGPRATPTFADGKLYALGATGILNCLDAATGELQWTQDIAPPKLDDAIKTNEESAPQRPYWGYASSPLVTGDVVVVFAAGDRADSLRAYAIDTGEQAWTAASGTRSYSSPQMATFEDEEQVLYLSELELTAVDPKTGRNRWRFDAGFEVGEPSIQPHVVGPSQVLVSFSQDAGTILLEVSQDDGAWKAEPVWKERDLKPYFNDFVRYEDSLYGFDGDIFACVDLKTGKRQWKRGRYGAGQVLLLADQGVLLVITEKGEAVLVAADPKEHRELAKFQAIEGKTWNHPTLVGDRLYVRNAEEMACYELKLE
jgi:outer membrane protein assembly factor BamB